MIGCFFKTCMSKALLCKLSQTPGRGLEIGCNKNGFELVKKRAGCWVAQYLH